MSIDYKECNIAEAIADTLINMMEQNPKVLYLDADLSRSLMGKRFDECKNNFSDQFIDCGVQEANMVGVATGLSATGKKPFLHTFAAFASRRVCDQLFLSACYAGNSIRMIGSDPGICAAYNGGTHMPFEDIGVLRSIPEMHILEPADPYSAAQLLLETLTSDGVFYLRCGRKSCETIYQDNQQFPVGGSHCLRKGKDVSIIASGIMVLEALKAGELLKEKGISAQVIDLYSIKPLDRKCIIECAKETGAIVTAENHNILGGLGDAVLHELAECGISVQLEFVGVKDSFGQVGSIEYLKSVYGLTAQDIASAAQRAICRKG